VPFYKEALARAKVSPEQIRSPGDVRRLPFTTKDDFRKTLGDLVVDNYSPDDSYITSIELDQYETGVKK
jgi:phenylacetate-CoA ligase